MELVGLEKETGSYVRRCVFWRDGSKIGLLKGEPPTVRGPETFSSAGLDCYVAKEEGVEKLERKAVSRCGLCSAVGAGSSGVRLKGRRLCQLTAGRDLCWSLGCSRHRCKLWSTNVSEAVFCFTFARRAGSKSGTLFFTAASGYYDGEMQVQGGRCGVALGIAWPHFPINDMRPGAPGTRAKIDMGFP